MTTPKFEPTAPKARRSWTEIGALAIDGAHGKPGMYVRLMRTEAGEAQVRICHMYKKERGPLREGKPCAFFSVAQAEVLAECLSEALARVISERLK
jgi:hypothetical protein